MSSPSSFEPPKPPASDHQPSIEATTSLIHRPPTIALACWLIIASAALGVVSFVARGQRESSVTVVVVLAGLVGFALLIRSGKNWARIVYLVFFLIGLSTCFFVRELIAQNGELFFAIFCLQTVLQGYAAWLVFRPPGNSWFKLGRTT